VVDLQKAQNRSLYIVARAYKATPIRNLEAETWVPPLDLYFNKRLADFEDRLQQPTLPTPRLPAQAQTPLLYRPPGQLVEEACRRIRSRFYWPTATARPTEPLAIESNAETIAAWKAQGQDSAGALDRAWKER
jgi:hypothetical protein